MRPSDTSDQRDHRGGRDGQCGSPRYPLLVYAGLPAQPIRRSCHPDGLKLFRLSRVLIFDLTQLRSFSPKSGPDHWPDAPTDVSAHRDFREYPFNGGRGASIDAEMSRYICVERSQRRTNNRSGMDLRSSGVRSILDQTTMTAGHHNQRTVSDQLNDFLLSVGIRIDVALRRADVRVTGKLLYVT